MLWFANPGYCAPHSEKITLPKPLMLSIKLLLQCESWPEIQGSLSCRTLVIYLFFSGFQGLFNLFVTINTQ